MTNGFNSVNSKQRFHYRCGIASAVISGVTRAKEKRKETTTFINCSIMERRGNLILMHFRLSIRLKPQRVRISS